MFTFYKIITILLYPVIRIGLFIRKIKGKEDETRFRERFGLPSISRPKGYLIWVHAASVGESMSALSLINHLTDTYPMCNILLTTGTVTSAKVIANKLPERVFHQYTPVDVHFFVKRFYDYWKPDLAILVESELWPNLINYGSKVSKMILINARMSDKSYAKFNFFKYIASELLNQLSLIMTQSEQDFERFSSLTSTKVINVGNLKYASEKLPILPLLIQDIKQQTIGRTILVAASTHRDDETKLFAALPTLTSYFENLLLIIVPRHPQRTVQIVDEARANNIKIAIRTNHDLITPGVKVYLANTLGELGSFYELADYVFIGGSFKNGGHNPIEPAHFKKPIIFGPDMTNFEEICQHFIDNKAAIQINKIQDIPEVFKKLGNKNLEKLGENAYKITKKNQKIITSYLKHLKAFIGKNA